MNNEVLPKKNSLWIKIPTLVLFFGAMVCFVAYRVGAFNGPSPAGANLASVTDSPKVIMHSTKSGKVIELPKENNKNQEGKSQQVEIMPSSKSMVLPVNNNNPAPAPDSVKSTPAPVPAQKKKAVRQKANKKAVQKKANKTSNNNNQVIMPSSKSGPMFAPDKAE